MRDRGYRRSEYEFDDLDRYRREGRYDLDDQTRGEGGSRGFGSGGPGRSGEGRYPTPGGQRTMREGRGRMRESNLGLERLPPPREERYGRARGSAGINRSGPFDRWEGEREQTWGGRRTYSSHPDTHEPGEAPIGRHRSHPDEFSRSGEAEYYTGEPEREQTWGGVRAYEGSSRDRDDYERGYRGGYSRPESGGLSDTDPYGDTHFENYRARLERNRHGYRAGRMDEELGRYDHYHRPASNRSDLSRWEYERGDLGYGDPGYDSPERDDRFEDDFRWRRNR